MIEKNFKIPSEKIKQLIKPSGSCIASDKITVDGQLVHYMYRVTPDFETDSGWRFFSGTESQEYVDDPNNSLIYDLNTIANYDPLIIPYLKMQVGSELERGNDNTFHLIK